MINKIEERSTAKSKNKAIRIAMLFQGAAHYWQPILSEFSELFPQTTVFAPFRSGFMPDPECGIKIVPVGKMKIISQDKAAKGYSPSVTYLSPAIVGHLFRYQPQIIFSTAFSIWTILATMLKMLFGWRTVIIFDGSSPGVERADSKLRFLIRRWLARSTDAFITNNHAGKKYLIKIIGTPENKVFVRPYLIPHPKTYAQNMQNLQLKEQGCQHPIFICAGKLIPRKGILELLQSCSLLTDNSQNYSLLIIGGGTQRQELEEFVTTNDLKDRVKFVGKVEYEQMGSYYQQADVFVFPTLEDVWGLVAVEAMMFGLPVLCSKWAGAAEMIAEGENGYAFDPHYPEELARLMSKFIDSPDLIKTMGEKSRQIMLDHKPEAVSQFLAGVVDFVCNE